MEDSRVFVGSSEQRLFHRRQRGLYHRVVFPRRVSYRPNEIPRPWFPELAPYCVNNDLATDSLDPVFFSNEETRADQQYPECGLCVRNIGYTLRLILAYKFF